MQGLQEKLFLHAGWVGFYSLLLYQLPLISVRGVLGRRKLRWLKLSLIVYDHLYFFFQSNGPTLYSIPFITLLHALQSQRCWRECGNGKDGEKMKQIEDLANALLCEGADNVSSRRSEMATKHSITSYNKSRHKPSSGRFYEFWVWSWVKETTVHCEGNTADACWKELQLEPSETIITRRCYVKN